MAAVSALDIVDTEVLLHPRTGYLIVLMTEVEHVAWGEYIFTALPLVSRNLNSFNVINISQSQKKVSRSHFFIFIQKTECHPPLWALCTVSDALAAPAF